VSSVFGAAYAAYNEVVSETLQKILEARVDRRGFLRGSGFAAAALVAWTATPASGQDRARPAEPAEQPAEPQPEQPERREPEEDRTANEQEEREPSGETAPSEETRVDAEGRPYRICPQCGFNMYKQERTWTCENCGYSYVE
jgi:hypothetical protein